MQIAKLICRLFGHEWDEFHVHDVVCSRCRICRKYTEEDKKNLATMTSPKPKALPWRGPPSHP